MLFVQLAIKSKDFFFKFWGYKILYPLIFLFFPFNLIAEELYKFYGTIGYEFYKRGFNSYYKALKEEETSSIGRFNLYFNSYFLNRRFLKYNLNFSLERGGINNKETSGNLNNFGYGIELNFFPKARDKFSLYFLKQNYNYNKIYGFDYEKKVDGYGIDLLYKNFYSYYKKTETQVPFFEEDERIQEEGLIKKSFSFNNFSFLSEIRRNYYNFKYFNNSQDINSFLTYLNGNGKSSNYNLNFLFQNYRYEDKNFGLKQSINFLNLSGGWNKKISNKTDSIFTLKTHKTFGGEENYNLEEILRIKLSENFRLETISGVLKVAKLNPYIGSGTIYEKFFQSFSFFSRVGFLFKQNKEYNGSEISPYGNFSLTFSKNKIDTSFDLAYYGFSYQQGEANTSELPSLLGEFSYKTMNDFSLKYAFNWDSFGIYGFHFKSIYNQYEREKTTNDKTRFNSFLNQVDFKIYSFSFGFTYYNGEEVEFERYKLSTKEAHISLSIGRGASFLGSYLKRYKEFSSKGEEEEGNIQFVYQIGKFSLRLIGQRLSYYLFEQKKEINYIRILLLRNFGNGS